MNRSNKIDIPLILVVTTLLLLGVLTVYSASSFRAIRTRGTSLFYLTNQTIPLILGIVIAFIASKINYLIWKKLALPILVITLFLLVYVLLFSEPINNVRRWIMLSGVSIQPGEIAKLSSVIWLSSYLSRPEGIRNQGEFLSIVGVSFIVILLLVLAPSFGIAFTVSLSLCFLMLVGGIKLKWLALLVGVGAGAFAFAISTFSYARLRFSTFLSGEVYQVTQSIQGIGAGGLFGVGLGEGRQKLLFLPHPHTDFIFSSLAEELGLIGSIVIFTLFALFFKEGIKIASHSNTRFGGLLAMGISFNIFISALLHIGVVSGMLPTTGQPLPFISYGGSSLVINLLSVGILLNISKQTVHRKI